MIRGKVQEAWKQRLSRKHDEFLMGKIYTKIRRSRDAGKIKKCEVILTSIKT